MFSMMQSCSLRYEDWYSHAVRTSSSIFALGKFSNERLKMDRFIFGIDPRQQKQEK